MLHQQYTVYKPYAVYTYTADPPFPSFMVIFNTQSQEKSTKKVLHEYSVNSSPSSIFPHTHMHTSEEYSLSSFFSGCFILNNLARKQKLYPYFLHLR